MKKRSIKLKQLMENPLIVGNIIFAVLSLIYIFYIKYKNRIISYSQFPFNIKDLDKFHTLIETKIIHRFEEKLGIKMTDLNVLDVCEKNYQMNEKFTLRFTYSGEVFLIENFSKHSHEKYIGNLNKMNDLNDLIVNIHL